MTNTWGSHECMEHAGMHMTSWSRNTQGYVLVIVMGLLAALGVMALALGAAARVDLAQTRRFQDETAAELLAKAGIDWTIHYVNTVERQGTLWQAPWTSQVALFKGRSLGVGAFEVQWHAALRPPGRGSACQPQYSPSGVAGGSAWGWHGDGRGDCHTPSAGAVGSA